MDASAGIGAFRAERLLAKAGIGVNSKGDRMVKSIRVVGLSAVFLLLGWTVPANSRQGQEDKPKNQEKQQQQARPGKQQQGNAPKQERQAKPQGQQQQAKGQQDRQQQDNSAKQQQQARGQQGQQRQQDNSARQQQQQHQQRQQQAKGQQDQQRQQRQQQAIVQQDQQRQQRQQQDTRSAQHRSPEQVRVQQVAWQGERAHSWQSEHHTWQQRGGYNGYRVPDDRFRSYYGQDHGFRIYSLPVMYVGGHRRFHYGGYWFGLVDPWPEYWSDDWHDSDDVYVDYYGDGYYLFNRRYPGDRIAISFYLH